MNHNSHIPKKLDKALYRQPVIKVKGITSQLQDDYLCQEQALEIRVNGYSVVVLMRTPGHDHNLVIGFLKSEGIIDHFTDIHSISYCDLQTLGTQQNTEQKIDEEHIMLVRLKDTLFFDASLFSRQLFASSSCGICSKSSIKKVLRTLELKKHTARSHAISNSNPCLNHSETRLKLEQLYALPEQMRAAQEIFKYTGGLHAAALFDSQATLICVAEDVGRHNAVDKVLGFKLQNKSAQTTILMLSGRVSFEIVQKAAFSNIEIIVAVSAPTSFAVQTAEAVGITLCGFVRDRRMNIYCHHQRIDKVGTKSVKR